MDFHSHTRTFLLVTLAFGGVAHAAPLHRYLDSQRKTDATPTACTFPDGTSPANRPESHCYTPEEFLRAYGIDQVHKTGLTGKGQTIILADSFGSPTMQADLDHFSDTFGLPHTTIQFIYPNGPYLNPLQTAEQLGWAQETTLDLEWAHAVAPDATLVNIITNNAETTGVTGFPDLFAGFATAVKQYPGSIISMSFGTGEATFAADEIKTFVQGSFHQILQDATNANITLLAGSGDSGSTNINTDQSSLYGFANAFYPASDPLITAVGGTALQAGWAWEPEGTANDYWTCKLQNTNPCPTDFLHFIETSGQVLESVWNEDWALAAGGGGVSTIFDAPQFQANLPANVTDIAKGKRAIPDMSMNAAINGGVDVYTSFVAPALGANGPKWQSFGGTSCATPEMAGVIALAGEGASVALGKTVSIGSLNSFLYDLKSSDFNDIVAQNIGTQKQVTIDNNGLFFSPQILAALGPTRVTPVAVPGYKTTEGYDIATGLGSPRALDFVLDLAHARAAKESQ